MKTAIFIYEAALVEALPELIERVKKDGEYTVISCGADIEFLLEEKNISYTSARSFLTIDPYQRLLLSRQLSKKIMDDDSLSFFNYRGINIAALFTPTLFYYLTHFLYYFDILISASELGFNRCYFFKAEFIDLPSAGVLAALNSRAFYDAFHLIKENSDFELEAVDFKGQSLVLQKNNAISQTAKRLGFEVAIRSINAYTRLFVPKKKIRILISEYWRNIRPLVEEMPDAEFAFLDRSESIKIGLRTISAHRMQFVHAEDFSSAAEKREVEDSTAALKRMWSVAKESHKPLKEASFRNFSLTSILENALDRFVNESDRVMTSIDGTFSMLGAMRPDIVAVRASISAQTHFAILCETARLMGIPSIEFQHGIFSVGAETETRERAAQYIAEYGPHERMLWKEHDFAPRSEFIDIGSPRFDEYIPKRDAKSSVPKKTFEILHIAPPWSPGAWNDSWDICTYFETMAAAVRELPNVHVTVKLRSSKVGEKFFREAIKRAFGEVSYDIVIFESLADLLPKADLIVTCHSTALLEALMSHRPVVLDVSLPVYTPLAHNDFQAYKEAGACEIAESPQMLKEAVSKLVASQSERDILTNKATEFMRKNFLFEDGKSSKRLAEAIREIIRNH